MCCTKKYEILNEKNLKIYLHCTSNYTQKMDIHLKMKNVGNLMKGTSGWSIEIWKILRPFGPNSSNFAHPMATVHITLIKFHRFTIAYKPYIYANLSEYFHVC